MLAKTAKTPRPVSSGSWQWYIRALLVRGPLAKTAKTPRTPSVCKCRHSSSTLGSYGKPTGWFIFLDPANAFTKLFNLPVLVFFWRLSVFAWNFLKSHATQIPQICRIDPSSVVVTKESFW